MICGLALVGSHSKAHARSEHCLDQLKIIAAKVLRFVNEKAIVNAAETRNDRTMRSFINIQSQLGQFICIHPSIWSQIVPNVIIAAEMLRRSRLRCYGVPRCAATR